MNKSESKYFNTAVKMDQALISLLKKKSLEYITVSEICKTAGVNRSTFYLHYETIGDLLNETARHLIDKFLSYFSVEIDTASFNFQTRNLDELVFICDQYLIPYLTYIQENKEVLGIVLSNDKALGVESIYRRMFEHIFNPILERFHYPQADRGYVMRYYLNGVNAIIVEWLKNGCDKSIEEMSKIIRMCIYGHQNTK